MKLSEAVVKTDRNIVLGWRTWIVIYTRGLQLKISDRYACCGEKPNIPTNHRADFEPFSAKLAA